MTSASCLLTLKQVGIEPPTGASRATGLTDIGGSLPSLRRGVAAHWHGYFRILRFSWRHAVFKHLVLNFFLLSLNVLFVWG
jgi:hypothetical protein